ncbi:MAG: transposase, partial [bacterium]|nr:transposase [bacterium]
MPGSKTLSSLHSRPPFAFAYLEPIQFPLCAIVATPFSQWLFPKLGRAIRYFINHHEALGRFIEDGAIPIDNSLIERQHVRVALTRK